MSTADALEMKNRLGKVSCSFCLAKWLQVTVHLQIGQTHSCHHPGTHKIPLAEIAANPSALHNTQFKKIQRKAMLEGKRPAECDYCWRIEDLPNQQISDRMLKSSEEWAEPHFDRVRDLPWDSDVQPTYLEVSFSHECNFRCLYCFPHISSSWEKEIERFGPYKLDRDYDYNSLGHLKNVDMMPIREQSNPYVDAFWEWMPDLYPKLEHLRVTGGEPLLAESTFKLLEYVREHKNEKLNLAINSNLGVPTAKVTKFIESAKRLENIASLSVFTSIDTWGPQAEYIRTGLKLPLFEKHFLMILEEIPKVNLTIMCTFNALSVESFPDLIEKLKTWKKLAQKYGSLVHLDISYLRYPDFLSVEILPQSWLPKFTRIYDAINAANENGMMDHEMIKMKRLVEYFSSLPAPSESHLKSFTAYVEESDRRKKTKFVETFPTYAEILLSGRQLLGQ